MKFWSGLIPRTVREANSSPFVTPDKSSGIDVNIWLWASNESKKEADAASGNVPSVRAGVHKESAQLKTAQFRFTTMGGNFFREANGKIEADGNRFKTIMLQEGLGNLKDAYYYSKQAIESAIPIFEGKKIYADHPSSTDEYTRPERSVRDVLGHFENVHVETASDGRAQLVGDVVVLDGASYDWARELMSHAVEFSIKFPDKEFIGISINASGSADEQPVKEFMDQVDIPESATAKLEKAIMEGLNTIRVVSAITDAVSADLVTEAGAGGKILELLEQEKEMKKEGEEHKEDEAKKDEGMKCADESNKEEEGDAPVAKADGEDEGHDDAGKDKELIKKMLKKHLGDEATDEDEAMAHEAYQACKEMGEKDDEQAAEKAVHGMKLAKHMASKKTEKKEAVEEDDKPVEKKEAAVEEKKESKEVVKLAAENAALKEKLSKIELVDHIRETLEKSHLPRAATAMFTKNFGEAKSKKHFDEHFKMFVETYKDLRGNETPYVIQTEKVTSVAKKDASFADCVN